MRVAPAVVELRHPYPTIRRAVEERKDKSEREIDKQTPT